jgi:hypothetical protein
MQKKTIFATQRVAKMVKTLPCEWVAMVQSEMAMSTIVGGSGSMLRAIRISVVSGVTIVGIFAIILYQNPKKITSSQ